jgi:hypothetical protein
MSLVDLEICRREKERRDKMAKEQVQQDWIRYSRHSVELDFEIQKIQFGLEGVHSHFPGRKL